MDDATAIAILELQLQELEDLLRNRKGKERAGTVNDFELACGIQIEEFQRGLTLISDRCMSRRSVGLCKMMVQHCRSFATRSTGPSRTGNWHANSPGCQQ